MGREGVRRRRQGYIHKGASSRKTLASTVTFPLFLLQKQAKSNPIALTHCHINLKHTQLESNIYPVPNNGVLNNFTV